MYSIETGQSPVAIVDIWLVSTADICPVSAADICRVSTADIRPVSTEDICPVSAADVLGGDENDFDSFFTPKMFKMEFIRWSPGVPGGARRNGGRDVETEPHQPRVMARITAVKQTPSNYRLKDSLVMEPSAPLRYTQTPGHTQTPGNAKTPLYTQTPWYTHSLLCGVYQYTLYVSLSLSETGDL